MKLMNILTKITTLVVVIFTFLSCDDDFNSVGSEIIGDVNFRDSLYTSVPVAYSKRLERVQTNSLISGSQGNQLAFHANLLGVYNDPVYGQSVYSILSQLQPERFDPDFGDNAVLDSVVLSIPYISRPTERETVEVRLEDASTITETATTYEIDSIYQTPQPYRLSIYQSNYFLRDFDPSTTERQAYYSDDIENFGAQVEETLLYTEENFLPSAEELILTTPDGNDANSARDRTRVSPRFRVLFSDVFNKEIKDKFKELFFDKEGSIELSNASNFNNYFRGIYFKAEPLNNTGNLLYLNIREARLTLHYSYDKQDITDENEDGNTDDLIRDQEEWSLAFTGNVINSIKLDVNPIIAEELKIENQNQVNGEDNLYLKGGAGSYAVLDLFRNSIVNENGEEENELDFIKRQNWLINDVNLKFYVDQDQISSGAAEPERIYIFNVETGEVLSDYQLDTSFQLLNSADPINSILSHLGRITRDSDDAGEFYRIRITQHIIDLLNGDIGNIKLGVSVSQNVNITTNALGDTSVTNDEIIPTSSIISHEGTILYGNLPSVPESKRLKLEIFYTESKDN
ncbi:DUF4270 domain-containing protein [Aquimarina celericrescens]|uniref:DUF4270 domain-containing protein n=1 Tax=Aquimarina celericrescens TaxID=1964542 RepID=A0ABW5AVN6_9FLAO|nr:DUF4270 domain-containing protein [Aquimarina celericrescens]